ncbi:MAG: hypothetical protein ABFD97_06165 [Syntrophobacter sp.]
MLYLAILFFGSLTVFFIISLCTAAGRHAPSPPDLTSRESLQPDVPVLLADLREKAPPETFSAGHHVQA